MSKCHLQIIKNLKNVHMSCNSCKKLYTDGVATLILAEPKNY